MYLQFAELPNKDFIIAVIIITKYYSIEPFGLLLHIIC